MNMPPIDELIIIIALYLGTSHFISNRLSGVMISVLASSTIDLELKLVFVASPLNTLHTGERTKTG
jgi:hypothetical protein